MQQLVKQESEPTSVIRMCDRDPSQPAEFEYVWDWGERGVCCAEQTIVLRQIAGSLKRSVQIYPLATAAPKAVPRDERIKLQSEILVLKAELEEAAQRGLELYRQNVRLAQEVQMLTVRDREARVQAREAEKDLLELRGKLDERDAEHGELVSEIERLRIVERWATRPGSEPPGGPDAPPTLPPSGEG